MFVTCRHAVVTFCISKFPIIFRKNDQNMCTRGVQIVRGKVLSFLYFLWEISKIARYCRSIYSVLHAKFIGLYPSYWISNSFYGNVNIINPAHFFDVFNWKFVKTQRPLRSFFKVSKPKYRKQFGIHLAIYPCLQLDFWQRIGKQIVRCLRTGGK